MSSERVGVVLCHEVWGITSALRAVAAAYEREGHPVAIADFYDGAYADEYELAAALRDALTLADIRAALQRAIDGVRRQGATRVAVVGYSMGGAISLWAAATLPVDLAVTYYGGGIARSYWADMPSGAELAGNLTTPWIGFYGGRDPITPAVELQALRDAASQAPLPGEVVIFDRADHGFALDHADPRHDEVATASSAAKVRDALGSMSPSTQP